MKETSKAYMAGLMDADGTFTITSCIHNTLGHRLYDPTVSCVSTFKPVLSWVVDVFGGTVYSHKITGTSKLPRFDWVTQSYKHSYNFVSTILPYIAQKHLQANILLEFYSLYRQQCPDKRQKLYEQITEENTKVSVTTNTQNILSLKNNLINSYFAGFFDGEGYVGYTNNTVDVSTSTRIGVGNTNLPLLQCMQSIYGGNIYHLSGVSRPSSRKPMWSWVLCSAEDVENFLLKMLPYLKTKREKSIELLNFIRNKMKIESDLCSDAQCATTVML